MTTVVFQIFLQYEEYKEKSTGHFKTSIFLVVQRHHIEFYHCFVWSRIDLTSPCTQSVLSSTGSGASGFKNKNHDDSWMSCQPSCCRWSALYEYFQEWSPNRHLFLTGLSAESVCLYKEELCGMTDLLSLRNSGLKSVLRWARSRDPWYENTSVFYQPTNIQT